MSVESTERNRPPEYSPEWCAHELFEARVRRTPEAIAVEFGEDRLSYRDLNAEANRIAYHLADLGVRPGDRVALCFRRGTAWPAGILGVMKAGAAYVPLDPTYPEERLRQMAEDSAPAAALTESALVNLFAAGWTTVLDIAERAWRNAPAGDGWATPGKLHSRGLAYVMFTSGSTGRPKGVMVDHRSLCNQLFWMHRELRIGPGDRVLLRASFAFDSSMLETLAPLSFGGRVAVVNEESQNDADRLTSLSHRHRVTYMAIPTALLRGMAEHPRRYCGEDLRLILCGGELLTSELVEVCRSSWPGIPMVNLYGPTEATVQATWWHFAETPVSGRAPIGKPVANTQVHILDERMRPAPAGEPGELYIGGAGVARGYLNRPDLTAERFLPDPFSSLGDIRMYRTGDLGRLLPDGNIEFLGRADSQVKIRGHRVEPGEIEARLAELPGVRQAVVVAREDGPGATRLIAYYSSDDDSEDDAGNARRLRGELMRRLPEYMVPLNYVRLAQMPLTRNGKIDRRALPEPTRSALRVAEPDASPSGADHTETIISRVAARVLMFDNVAPADNLFDLGLDSVLSLSLLAELREQGFSVSLAALHETQTPRALARFIEANPETPETNEAHLWHSSSSALTSDW
jgi:amino acid adenylation domain-containing protein